MDSDMKGLDVARGFFNEWGLPYLRSHFPQVSERAACFICGGSESLGNDDELSRDHHWGPYFSVVLVADDWRRYGRRLKSVINTSAPREWQGCKFYGDESITVDPIDSWFRYNGGWARAPQDPKIWRKRSEYIEVTLEHRLYMMQQATVFHDPLSEFTSRRAEYRSYPRPVWLGRLAQEAGDVLGFGQYNFLGRLTTRKDPIAISVCLGNFIHASMKTVLLLERGFTPYWKWVPAEFRKLQNVSEMEAWLTELSRCMDLEGQAVLVEQISRDVHSRLVSRDLIKVHPEQPYSMSLAFQELLEAATAR